MPRSRTAAMLDKLALTVDAVAVCEVGANCALRVEPLDQIIVHFVLKGEGSIETASGFFPIRAGMIAVIPAGTPKLINGGGVIETTFEADKACPLEFGILRYRALSIEHSEDLVLCCALITATAGNGVGVFDHLQQPLTQHVKDGSLSSTFETMISELSRPLAGGKAMIQALMMQILLCVLREHLDEGSAGITMAGLFPHPQLKPALTAMISRPQDPHCLDSLSRLAGMSRSRFTHHFAEAYLTSPMSYLQLVRLRAAARLLQTSAIPIKAVAGAVGFRSRSYFSRAFTDKFGIDPSRFRDSGMEQSSESAELATAG